MITQFAIEYSFEKWLLNNFLNHCDNFTASYIKTNIESWEENDKLVIILDHYYNDNEWFIIYDAYSREVKCVGLMPKNISEIQKKHNGLLDCLVNGYKIDYGTLVESYITIGMDERINVPNKSIKESFDDAFDSSLLDYSKDFEDADYNSIYHPDVVADVNVSFDKMKKIKTEILPLVKDFKISTCSIKARTPKNFRVESYIHKTGQWLGDIFFEWGIRYNYKMGSNLKTGTFMSFERGWKDGKVYGFPGGSCALEPGSKAYEFLTSIGGIDSQDGYEWRFDNI